MESLEYPDAVWTNNYLARADGTPTVQLSFAHWTGPDTRTDDIYLTYEQARALVAQLTPIVRGMELDEMSEPF